MEVEVHVPLSISGIWYPVYTDNPLTTGSIGLTLTLEPFIVATVKEGEGLVFNGNEIKDFPNYEYLKRKLGTYKMVVESRVPLGYGYGLSGALSLAYALGVKELKGVKEEEAVNQAHISEVINSNGLGDVIAQYYGKGLVYRKKPGGLGVGEVEVIELDWSNYPIYTKTVEQLPTKSIIKKNENALKLIQDFLNSPSPLKFIEVASIFTRELGFTSPYPYSYRKKGVIVKIFEPNENIGWIKHEIAKRGAYVK
ncbi:MAG: pantoate kinase [Sulfolobaceae archaeon]|nr:pantoate kinase [Sulfolobaceae archaeon]